MSASTIPDMLSATRRRYPDSIALENGEGTVSFTYSELEQGAELWSRSLSSIVSPGNRIAVMMEGGVTLSRWILAVMWKHSVVPLRPDLSEDDLRRYLEVTQSRYLLTPSTSEALGQLCSDIGVAVLSPETVTDLDPRSPDEIESPTDTSVAVVLLTSGSTGKPKVVPLTHKNLLTSTRDMARALDLSESDRCLVQWSQYHIGGLIDHLLAPLSTGGTIINGGSFSLEVMKRLLKTARPTWTQFVPATLDETLRDSERQSAPLAPNTLRFIRCVAAPMNEELWERAERALDCPLLHAYGMTEASPLVTATPLGLAQRTRGSTGRSVGPEIRIVDENDHPLGPGIEGSIQVRGANVFDGYEGEPDLNEATFIDGWFRTGDLGYLDADGELFVRGREKNMINRGGEKVNPMEVEDALRRHPSVADVAVFGLPHRRLGHIVAAAVTVTTNVDSDNILAFAAEVLSPHKVPAQILMLDELPKLGVGKVDLARLVEISQSRETRYSHTYRSTTEKLMQRFGPMNSVPRTFRPKFPSLLRAEILSRRSGSLPKWSELLKFADVPMSSFAHERSERWLRGSNLLSAKQFHLLLRWRNGGRHKSGGTTASESTTLRIASRWQVPTSTVKPSNKWHSLISALTRSMNSSTFSFDDSSTSLRCVPC